VSVSRTEYKFLISKDQYESWKKEISERLEVDQNPGNSGDYPILSQYYDTAERDCYWEKQRRFRSRRKIRVRVYGSETAQIPPAAFLEVKHKLDGLGVKRRLPMPVADAQAFCLGDEDILHRMVDKVGRSGRIVIAEVLGMTAHGHAPAMQIRYDRKAFSSPDESLRVTFDNLLRCRTDFSKLPPDDPDFPNFIIPPDQSVMEVKSIGPVPYWFRVRAGETGLTRQSFSKYCTSLEKHDPVLRAQFEAGARARAAAAA
jgi:hypothetical protein